MLDFLAKHPVIYAFLLVLFFLFWILPPWLAAVWPLFSPQEEFPDWLARKGWYGMKPYLSGFVLVISTLSVIGLLCAILYAVTQHRTEVGWLETIADEDSKDMANRIMLISGPEVTTYLDSPDPFVDFKIGLRNFSVYTVTFERLEGSITFRGQPLAGQPQVVEEPYELTRNQSRPLYLRLYLQLGAAQEIKDKGPAALSTQYSSLCFTYRDRFGVVQRTQRAAVQRDTDPPALP